MERGLLIATTMAFACPGAALAAAEPRPQPTPSAQATPAGERAIRGQRAPEQRKAEKRCLQRRYILM